MRDRHRVAGLSLGTVQRCNHYRSDGQRAAQAYVQSHSGLGEGTMRAAAPDIDDTAGWNQGEWNWHVMCVVCIPAVRDR